MNFNHIKNIISALIVALTILVLWSWSYNRLSIENWKVPLDYTRDGLHFLALEKAYLDGDITPFGQKFVARLNGPYTANWNDFPRIEDLIPFIYGNIANIIGLMPSTNLMVLWAQILAGLTFLFIGIHQNYNRLFVIIGSLLFALSPYAFSNARHFNLINYWHIPLYLLIIEWLVFSVEINRSKKWFAISVSVVTGVLNPYYSAIYMQFIGFIILKHIVNKSWDKMTLPVLLLFCTLGSALFMNIDTLSYQLEYGKNASAVSRGLSGLERWGLALPQLIYPINPHRCQWLADFAHSHYFGIRSIQGGHLNHYLGIIGILSLIGLMIQSFYFCSKDQIQSIPIQAWQVLWVLLFAMIGGVNLLMGTWGFLLLRGTNRYSIVILAILLIFMVRQLSKHCPYKLTVPLGVCLLLIGLWDQLPIQTSAESINNTRQMVTSDRLFVQQLEKSLPKGSMLFQLPVILYPEMGTLHAMYDYEHFRPYLYSKSLRFSYGSNKGRPREAWQNKISHMNASEIVSYLKSYGFEALMINRNGFKDYGKKIIAAFQAEGKYIWIESMSGDLVAFRL